MNTIELIQEQVENIKTCNNGINVIAELLIQFQIDSDCNNEIPATVKNGFIHGGLLAAISVLINASERSAEWIEEEINRTQSEECRCKNGTGGTGDFL